MKSLYLASGSPRRRNCSHRSACLYRPQRGYRRNPLPDESPAAYVERLARDKAAAGHALIAAGQSAACVLGADTAVVLDGRILGKPLDQADAQSMLMALSDREHEVLTAIAVLDGQRCESRVVRSLVRFRAIGDDEAARYWASGEPCDKAGGYGIQGLAAVFVAGLNGSYSAVVGLPVCETAELLGHFGIPCWQNLAVR